MGISLSLSLSLLAVRPKIAAAARGLVVGPIEGEKVAESREGLGSIPVLERVGGGGGEMSPEEEGVGEEESV